MDNDYKYDPAVDVYVYAGGWSGENMTAFFKGVNVCQLSDGKYEMWKSEEIPISRGWIRNLPIQRNAGVWEEAQKYAFASFQHFKDATKEQLQVPDYVRVANELTKSYCQKP